MRTPPEPNTPNRTHSHVRFEDGLLARINKQIPQYLIYDMVFEDKFWPSRDLRCSMNGIDFVIDIVSSQRMRKTVMDWNEEQQGFEFDSPEWPRLNTEREPWQETQDS